MGPVFEYVVYGRRPVTYAIAGLVAAVFVGAIQFNAPPIIWGTWLPVGIIVVAYLWRKPSGRIQMDNKTLWVKTRSLKARWPLKDIQLAEITTWDDEPDTCRLHFAMNETELLPEEVTPDGDALADAFYERGVSVKIL